MDIANLTQWANICYDFGSFEPIENPQPKDALHLASAEKTECDWFLTVDKGILKKVREYKTTRVANPVEFIMENEYGND